MTIITATQGVLVVNTTIPAESSFTLQCQDILPATSALSITVAPALTGIRDYVVEDFTRYTPAATVNPVVSAGKTTPFTLLPDSFAWKIEFPRPSLTILETHVFTISLPARMYQQTGVCQIEAEEATEDPGGGTTQQTITTTLTVSAPITANGQVILKMSPEENFSVDSAVIYTLSCSNIYPSGSIPTTALWDLHDIVPYILLQVTDGGTTNLVYLLRMEMLDTDVLEIESPPTITTHNFEGDNRLYSIDLTAFNIT
jgi:hypothetical protein